MNERRDAYVAKMKARLERWNEKIDALDAAGHKVKTDSKAAYDSEIKHLKARRREFEEKVENLRKAGDGAWQDLKAGVKESWKIMDDAVRSAASNFRQAGLPSSPSSDPATIAATNAIDDVPVDGRKK